MAVEIFPRATTYVDESVRHDRETGKWFCCVTSYVASFVEWVRAEIEWQGVLDAFAVSESHLTDFMARKKEFDNDWSNSKRDQFMERLCTIASERPIMGVGCAISQVDWEDGLSASLRAEWEDPYYFCLYGMLSLIRTEVLVDRRYSLPVPLYFLFDNKPKFEGAARRIYQEYQREHDPKEEIFGDIAFGSRKRYKPLQVADLLVGVINRRFQEMTKGMDQEVSKMKKPMDLLFKKPLLMAFPNAELINEFGDFARRRSLQA